MATQYVTTINFGDNVNRLIKDSESVHSIQVNGVAQSVSGNAVNLDVATNLITEAQWTTIKNTLGQT